MLKDLEENYLEIDERINVVCVVGKWIRVKG